MISNYLFAAFSAGILISSACVVFLSNPMYALLALIVAFFQAAGLFLLFKAEFLAMLVLIVYIGAVCILILFVVMFLNVASVKRQLSRFQKASLFVGLALLAEMILVGLLWQKNMQPVVHHKQALFGDGMSNTMSLGMYLYTTYAFAFQVCGVILLVAMIGAIVLTFKKEKRGRPQDIATQNARTPEATLKMTNPPIGQGVDYDGI